MSDKLDMMFSMQYHLQKRLNYVFKDFDNHYFNLMYIGCITELSEVMENTKWKPWKKSSHNDIGKVKEELVDVLHFFINMCLACNFTSEELYHMYIEKNNENNRRQNNGY